MSASNRFCFLSVFYLFFPIFFNIFPTSKEKKLVAITQIVQHPSLDKMRRGVLDELKEAGFMEGQHIEIVYEDAQGSMTTATQIAHHFVSLKPDVIVALTTPSAQTILKYLKGSNIFLVYGGVTDPVGAKLIPSLTETTTQVTGTMDVPPVEDQIRLVKKMVPTVKKIGIIYNPGEANNFFQVEAIKHTAKAHGLEVIESLVTKSSDVSASAHFLVKEVEAFLLPNDNTVISSLEPIIRIAHRAKIPVFCSDPDSVERGAVASVSNDQYQVGRQTGHLVVEILKGKSPSDLLSQKVTGAKIYQNKKVMKNLNLPL